MQSVRKEYLLLFNAITDTEESLRRLRADLMAVQQQAEELFVSEDAEAPSKAEGGA